MSLTAILFACVMILVWAFVGSLICDGEEDF